MGKRQKPSRNNPNNYCTLYVDGMHCSACEVLIERKLVKLRGISSAHASLAKRKVEIHYTPNNQPEVDDINAEFKELGYTFHAKEPTSSNVSTISFTTNGSIIVNPTKLKRAFLTGVLISLLIIAFFLIDNLHLGQYVSVDSTSALSAFFLLGIVAGLSSCAALIGGLLLSLTKQWNEQYIDASTQYQKATPHILFHLGRLVSFAVFGGLLGLAGEAIGFNNPSLFAILTIVVSLIMILLAMQMLGYQWATRIKLATPKIIGYKVMGTADLYGSLMPFTIGAATFLLPCGFTLVAQTVALTSGSFLQGALIMLAFALGTLPILLGISFGGLALNTKPQLSAKFNIIAGILVAFFAIYNINGQLNVLGLPSLSDISFSTAQATEQFAKVNAQGQQELKVIARGFEYIASGPMTISAGVPTKLIIDNQGVLGCAAYMAANGLMTGFVALQQGVNQVDLGIPQKGTYKLTCTMGMVRPITITVI